MISRTTKAAFAQVAPLKRVRLGRPGTSLKLGLLGMANIGKSSTFNMITNLNVPAENIPFCTINPNEASIPVKDERFDKLCALYKPQKRAGPILRIVDIAGLVKGASEGFGLGNEFLSHVMQVDGLYHVVRAFPGESIAHTEGGMDAVRDINIIRHELIMKDLDIVGRKVKDMGRKAAKTQDKMLKEEYEIILKVQKTLKDKFEIRNMSWTIKQIEILNKLMLLTSKPMIYLLNLSKEDYLSSNITNKAEIEDTVSVGGKFATKIIPYSIEYEKSIINGSAIQKQRSQIHNIIKAGYEELELIHYYTVGTDQVKAWAIRLGQTAMEAAGKIHSELSKGFINAEVIHADNLISNPSWKDKLAKHSKKQSKSYLVKDGDIMHFNSKIK